MISKIDSITNFGVFKNFDWNKPTTLPFFKEKSIIYGWNYSGKTTLSRIFSSIRDKKIHEDFDEGNFKITTSDNKSYTKDNLNDFPFNILVFNSEYVKENLKLDFGNDVNAIFFEVGEDAKIAYKIEKLNILIESIEGSDTLIGKKAKYLKAIQEYEAFENHLFTSEAKKIKDDYFISLINFTKGDVRKIKDYLISDIDNQIIKDKKDLKRLSLLIKTDKPKAEIIKISFDNNYSQIKFEVDQVLSKTPEKRDIIEILEKAPEAYKWAQTGLTIHENQKKCLFCDNIISDDRIKQLKLFFENQSSKLKLTCTEIRNSIFEEQNKISNLGLPNSSNDFNEGFQDDFLEIKKELDVILNNYRKHLQQLLKKIDQKSNKSIYTELAILKSFDVGKLVYSIQKLNSLIERNNEFTNRFDIIISAERDKFKNHLVASFLKSSNYILKQDKAKLAYQKIEKFDNQIKVAQDEINLLAALKESDSLGCARFEAFINEFLGKDDIQIKLNEETSKYNLLRNGVLAKNLSEGERMAISFSHFLVTIESLIEKSKFSNYVVFIDDPISSLDGNHIFQINSLLKDVFFENVSGKYQMKCRQLFISTHNFDFFNLIKELPDKGAINESKFYISRLNNESLIEKLPDIFDKFQSEYHYLFSEIMSFYKTSNKSTYSKLLLMPNIIRRFLEIYTMSQYPITGGLDSRANKIFGIRKSKRICKPLHYYSHFNNIDKITKQSEFIVDVGKACEELIGFFEENNDIHYQALKLAIK